jgi:hypothetical protein
LPQIKKYKKNISELQTNNELLLAQETTKQEETLTRRKEAQTKRVEAKEKTK